MEDSSNQTEKASRDVMGRYASWVVRVETSHAPVCGKRSSPARDPNEVEDPVPH